ncbi:MAG: hypothetical protein ACOCWV_05770 [Planctomycetota bacterium]
MMDDQNEVRRVNWTEVFSFTHIFKSFRMAIQPSKLALALAAIIVLVVSGGVMGWVWSLGGATAYPNEIQSHYQLSETAFDNRMESMEESRPNRIVDTWRDAIGQTNKGSALNEYRSQLTRAGGGGGYYETALKNALDEEFEKAEAQDLPKREDLLEKAEDDPSDAIAEIRDEFEKEIVLIEKMLAKADEEASKLIDDDTTLKGKDDLKEEAREQLAEDKAAARRALTLRKRAFQEQMLELEGKNIFSAFIGYEWDCITKALRAVAHGNILTGMDTYRATMAGKGPTTVDVQFPLAPNAAQTPPAENPPGFFVYVLMAIHAVAWLWDTHMVFAILYLLIALATCSLFGGAIHRICAVHFAREEKISAGQALKFSIAKFPNFLTAPLIPLAVIFGLGALILLGGFLLGSWGGGILMGILLPVALILGMFIAFMAIGLIAGGPLMFPTIAVEGSDSFDAISRSFSYVFAKPWRSALYGLAALVYGVVTYLFVRVFVYITLCGTQWFARGGVGWGGDALSPDADKIDVIWAAPQFDALWGRFNWHAMGPLETVGAVLIGFWTFLLAAMVAAYLLSYVASSTTAIYYLLRREVDSTDLDDVYVEEADEQEFPAPQAVPAEAPESAETPAEDEGGSEDASEQTEETSEQSDDEEGSDEKKDEGDEG